MFCQKCGNKLEDNAVFCPKCGERLPVTNSAEQSKDNDVISAREKADETVRSIETATKAYEMLREKAALCPEVKNVLVDEGRSVAVVEGKFNRYTVKVSNGQIGLSAFPVFPFVIPMGLCILSVVLLVVTMYMDAYYWNSVFWGLYNEVLISLVGLFALLSGLSGIIVSVSGNKEKQIVLPFVRQVLGQSKYIEQFQHIEMVAYSIFVFCGVCFFLLFGVTM